MSGTGDAAAFAAFLASARGRRLRRVVLAIGRRGGIAEDVWQDVQEWALTRWAMFEGPDHVAALCAMKAANLVKDHHRNLGDRLVLQGVFAEDALGEEPDPLEELVKYEENLAAWSAFRSLPLQSRRLLLDLLDAEGYAALAHERKASEGAVRVQVHRARTLLRASRAAESAAVAPGLVAVIGHHRVLVAVRRAVRNVLQPASAAGRLVVGLTVACTTLSLAPVPPIALPAYVTAAPARRIAEPSPVRGHERAGDRPTADTHRETTMIVGAVPTSPTPTPEATCLAGVCLHDQPSAGPPIDPEGMAVCILAAERCVSQQELGGVCAYLSSVPPDAITCAEYGEPEQTLPPPPTPH